MIGREAIIAELDEILIVIDAVKMVKQKDINRAYASMISCISCS